MTSRSSLPARSTASADQENHCAFTLTRSIRTLLSIKTPGILLAAGKRHDFFRRHLDLAAVLFHVVDDPLPPAVPALALGADDPHGLAVIFEIDLHMRQKPCPLADFGRDGDLSLRRDAHERCYSSYSKK